MGSGGDQDAGQIWSTDIDQFCARTGGLSGEKLWHDQSVDLIRFGVEMGDASSAGEI
jgi:hypothetical protein